MFKKCPNDLREYEVEFDGNANTDIHSKEPSLGQKYGAISQEV